MEEIKKYKYLLHGHFDNNISRMIDNTRKYMLKKYKKYKYNGEFNYGYPHITIIYGPVIKSKNEIEINKKVINKFYPGFLNNFNKLPNDIKYIGITPFFALDRVIIKAEFESKQLNKIRKYLIDCNPEIKQYYNEFKISKKNIEKDLKKKYPNIYIKDKSYNKIPKGWIHVTILVLHLCTFKTPIF